MTDGGMSKKRGARKRRRSNSSKLVGRAVRARRAGRWQPGCQSGSGEGKSRIRTGSFRAWCVHCDDTYHILWGEAPDSDVMCVFMDYCFFTEGVSSKIDDLSESVWATIGMIVRVMVETLCLSVWAYAVMQKRVADD